MVILLFVFFFSQVHGFSNGGLDTSFNPNGAFPGLPGVESVFPLADYSNSATFAVAEAVVIDANGKIVAAGQSDADPDGRSMTLMRLNDNGSLDTTLNPAPAHAFPGVPGIETIWTASFGAGTVNATAAGIGLLSDGRIVLAGDELGSQASPTNDRAFAAVLLHGSDGSLDTSFNPIGAFPGVQGVEDIWTESHGTDGTKAQAFGVAIQANDRIILAGAATTTEAGGGVSIDSMSIARLLTDGSLDSSFNAGHTSAGVPGIATLYTASFGAGTTRAIANAVAIEPATQNIVIAGFVDQPGEHMAAVRLTPAGILDPSFNVAGPIPGILVIPNTTFGLTADEGAATAVALQQDGKIVIAGLANTTAGGPPLFTVVRLTNAGVLDPTFNSNGAVVVPLSAFDPGATQSEAAGVKIQSDGAIVATGLVTIAGNNMTAIVRLTPTGALDTTFVPSTGETGTPGAIVIPSSTFAASTESQMAAVVLDSQQRIITAGDADPSAKIVFALVRLESTAAPTGPKSCIAQAIIAKYCS